MAITQTLTTSFKVELLQGVHNFGPTSPNTFKIALYTSTASLNADTTAYTSVGEVSSSGTGYTAGGETLVISTSPTNGGSGTTAYVSFSDVTWISAAFTAVGALIYNTTQGGKSVAVLNFGGDKTPTASTFTVQFPSATSTAAIIRIA